MTLLCATAPGFILTFLVEIAAGMHQKRQSDESEILAIDLQADSLTVIFSCYQVKGGILKINNTGRLQMADPAIKYVIMGKEEGMGEQRSEDLLHGITLQMMLTQLVTEFGWEELGRRIDIRCFNQDPSISSSLKFLRRTSWARNKVEELYLKWKLGCV